MQTRVKYAELSQEEYITAAGCKNTYYFFNTCSALSRLYKVKYSLMTQSFYLIYWENFEWQGSRHLYVQGCD